MPPEPQLDVEALYAALDQRRKSKGLSWRRAADEAHVSASTLTRLGQGKRPDVDSFAALVHWLAVPPDRFLRSETRSRQSRSDVMTVISTHLRAQKDLSPAGVKALEEIIRTAYQQLRKAGK